MMLLAVLLPSLRSTPKGLLHKVIGVVVCNHYEYSIVLFLKNIKNASHALQTRSKLQRLCNHHVLVLLRTHLGF